LEDSATFTRAAPVLAALEIEMTVLFYEQRLGFPRVLVAGDAYAIVRRDGVDIHFWNCPDKYIAENTSCYIFVENVDLVFQEYQARGVSIAGALETKPWGVREFAILDSNGNLLKIGERVNRYSPEENVHG
jgi:uncharacterized glyoxalase superfamily protein PhnB